MMAFSVEEFNIMVDELLYREPASFDMLCQIAEQTLRSSVRRWCAADAALCGRGFEDDIMQEICIRLIKTCVSSFLLRNGTVNDDAAGFQSWMFKVAHNIWRDYASRMRRIVWNVRGFEENEEAELPDTPALPPELEELRIERLSRAFAIVLEADAQVYKILTWVAQCLFIIDLDVTKIRSNELILQTFGEKTLYEMRDMLFAAARKIVWMEITLQQAAKIENALDAPYDAQRVYGVVRYDAFFMKKGGKATISDWVNRMNGLVRRVMADEAYNG